MHPELAHSCASVVAKKYPDVTAEQLKASVREAGKGGKSDSEIAPALRGKYQCVDCKDLLADVREAALKGAEHDQLLKSDPAGLRPDLTDQAKVIAKTETNRAFLDEPVPGLPVPSSERFDRPRVGADLNEFCDAEVDDLDERAKKRPVTTRCPRPC